MAENKWVSLFFCRPRNKQDLGTLLITGFEGPPCSRKKQVQKKKKTLILRSFGTVDGNNPTPVDIEHISFFIGFHTHRIHAWYIYDTCG